MTIKGILCLGIVCYHRYLYERSECNSDSNLDGHYFLLFFWADNHAPPANNPFPQAENLTPPADNSAPLADNPTPPADNPTPPVTFFRRYFSPRRGCPRVMKFCTVSQNY